MGKQKEMHQMELIPCKMDGVKWIVVGSRVLVDPAYIDEYGKSSSTKCKRNGISCHDIKLTVSVAFITIGIHAVFNLIMQ